MKRKVQINENLPNIIHTWSDKSFNGSVVNHWLPSLHGGSLKIRLTVPYKIFLHTLVDHRKKIWNANYQFLCSSIFYTGFSEIWKFYITSSIISKVIFSLQQLCISKKDLQNTLNYSFLTVKYSCRK